MLSSLGLSLCATRCREARELQGRARKKAREVCWADSSGRPWASLEPPQERRTGPQLLGGLTEDDLESSSLFEDCLR